MSKATFFLSHPIEYQRGDQNESSYESATLSVGLVGQVDKLSGMSADMPFLQKFLLKQQKQISSKHYLTDLDLVKDVVASLLEQQLSDVQVSVESDSFRVRYSENTYVCMRSYDLVVSDLTPKKYRLWLGASQFSVLPASFPDVLNFSDLQLQIKKIAVTQASLEHLSGVKLILS